MKPKSHRTDFLRTPALASLFVVCSLTSAHAVTGTWNVDAATTWTTAASWSGGIIPNGVGDVANFTNNIGTARTITLTGDKTVGEIKIGDSATAFVAFSIQSGIPLGSQLIFDQTGVANALLTVPNVGGVAANQISTAGILLKDNLVIRTDFPNSATTQVTLSSLITDGAGSFSITKEGPGIIQLSSANTYEGGTIVNGGRLNANSSVMALGSGLVTVASGGQVLLNSSVYNDFTIAGTGYNSSADTLSQVGAIRFINNRGVMGNLTVTAAARIGVDTTANGFIRGNLSGIGDLEVNGPTATTGSLTLFGSASGYSGTLSVPKGGFNFSGAFGGSIAVAPTSAVTTGLGAGTSISGTLTLDSTNAATTLRNNNGTLGIIGNLVLTGTANTVIPGKFPAPGAGSMTLMTYASHTGAGTLTFIPTGYRGTPTLSVGGTSAVISGLDLQTRTWNATTGTWSADVVGSWAEGDAKFCHGDAVVFGDVGAGTITATLTGTATPGSITFNNTSTHDYVLTGGVIDGGTGIVKNGSGKVTLGGINTFTGPIAVNAGRLVLGNAEATGYTSGVTVASGAAFDLNGKFMPVVSRAVDITLGGAGDGTVQALTNTGPDIGYTGAPTSGVRNVTLTADATIGGTGAFDIGGSGVIDGGGFTLTKTGTNTVYLTGVSKNLRTIVAGGTLYGLGVNPFGSTLLIKNGAIAGGSANGTHATDVTIEAGGTLTQSTGTEVIWTGTFTALGSISLGNGTGGTSDCTIVQGFSIPGNLTKIGASILSFQGTIDVSGSVSVTAGSLYLGTGKTTGGFNATTPISVTGASTNLLILRSDDLAFPNDVTVGASASFTKSGSNLVTLTGTNSINGTLAAGSGTLRLGTPVTGTGGISVSAGATLEGNTTTTLNTVLSAGSPVAVISPGSPGGTIGSLSTANLTFNTTSTATSSFVAQINTDTGTCDKITVNGNLNLGSTATFGALLNVTNLGTATPADGAKFTLISYTGTLTNTFAGLPEGGTVTISGVPYIIRYADGGKNVTLAAPASAYGTWISSYYLSPNPAVLGPLADPDGDGVSNLVEYALVGDPSDRTMTNLPTTSRVGGDYVLSFYRSSPAIAAGYATTIEYSETLAPGSWVTATAGMTDAFDLGPYEAVTVTIPIPSGAKKFFTRVRVTGP